jgi:hypothetical protein
MVMKKLIQNIICLLTLTTFIYNNAQAQNITKPTLTVLNIETKGVPLDPQQMGNLTRIEIEKLDTFSVTDRYDVIHYVEKKQLNINNCYGKLCLVEVGKSLGSQYMLSGSVELYGQTIVFTYRLIDVEQEKIVSTTVMEFLNLPLELQQMSGITIRKMFGYSNNPEMLDQLTKRYNYESAVNNPDKNRLNLQGPRFGYTFAFGPMAEVMMRDRSQGGYGVNPAMFQFGYQFEKQYLNEGKFQALFEFIPMVTGFDQQMVLPSITVMNGFRNNVSGWEVAIGPSFSLAAYTKVANVDGQILTEEDLLARNIKADTKRKLDSRGLTEITSALVIGFGKTVKSGKLNIPMNMWCTIPTNEGFRMGVSIGYNAKK